MARQKLIFILWVEFKDWFSFACDKGIWQIMSIRTVHTDGIGCSQSVHDPKIACH